MSNIVISSIHYFLLFHIYFFKILLLFIIGCDAKHFLNLIKGSWGEQPDLETPPKDEDEPAFKRFKASSPMPSTASASSTISPSTPQQPPTKHFIPPWEVGALAGIPASQRPSYELRDGETKKYYCQVCGNATGNHNSVLTHVCRIHLNISFIMSLL